MVKRDENMGKKFERLEKKIERSEAHAHPMWDSKHIEYVAKAAAGKVARSKHHHCALCGVTH